MPSHTQMLPTRGTMITALGPTSMHAMWIPTMPFLAWPLCSACLFIQHWIILFDQGGGGDHPAALPGLDPLPPYPFEICKTNLIYEGFPYPEGILAKNLLVLYENVSSSTDVASIPFNSSVSRTP